MNKLLISISILFALAVIPVYAEQGTIQIWKYNLETAQLFDVTIQICSTNEVIGEKSQYPYPQTLNLPTQTYTAYSDERKYGETHEHNGYVASNSCVNDIFTIVASDPKTIVIKSNDLKVITGLDPEFTKPISEVGNHFVYPVWYNSVVELYREGQISYDDMTYCRSYIIEQNIAQFEPGQCEMSIGQGGTTVCIK